MIVVSRAVLATCVGILLTAAAHAHPVTVAPSFDLNDSADGAILGDVIPTPSGGHLVTWNSVVTPSAESLAILTRSSTRAAVLSAPRYRSGRSRLRCRACPRVLDRRRASPST